ncbi:MAG: phosphoglycerate mutase [Rhodanobacter sp.]
MNKQSQLTLHWWLPTLQHFASTHPLREWLPRADRLEDGAAGYLAGLADYFQGGAAPLSSAALTRELLAGDAADATWVSADPAWARPDINGIRLMACGNLQLTMEEAEAFAAPLRPVFGDAGMQLELSTPDHWHLRLPGGSPLPEFSSLEQAMGEDLSEHLPQGTEGRRWRLLLNDIQILLHQNPLNIERRKRGVAPVNSLWLWGGGRLPSAPRTELLGVLSDDLLLRALAQHAGIPHQVRSSDAVAAASAGDLLDLQDLPSDEIAAQWWPLLLPMLERQTVLLHFASGERWLHKPRHHWRFWRGAGR